MFNKYHRSAAICLLAFGIISFTSVLNAQNDKPISIPKVGDKAPEFSLQDFNGNKFELSKAVQQHGLLLWFTNLCEGCQSKISDVEKIKSVYEKKGVNIAAVSVLGEDRKTVEQIIKDNKITFPFLYDPDGKVAEIYSGKYIPGTCPLKNIYIISKDGKITFASHLPGVKTNELIKQLDRHIDKGDLLK
ncbi:MAG: peroxiredoxin family protein [Bacteroidota bacterium]